MNTQKNKCVVSFSAGQDSTTVAAWAKKHFDEVVLLSFDYNQKHTVELKQAEIVAKKMGLEHHIIRANFFGDLVESALTSNSTQNVNDSHKSNSDLPASFVPNRNAFFIVLSHSFAQKIGAQNLALGVSQEDYSGYPDCRREFIDKIKDALNNGSSTNIEIHTPVMFMGKDDEFQLAEDLGVLDLVINDSHTCYNGNHEDFHDWGYGCGECNACKLRSEGFRRYKERK